MGDNMAISHDVKTMSSILSHIRDDVYGELQGLMEKYDSYKLKDWDMICSVDVKVEQYGNVNIVITLQDYNMIPLPLINEIHQTYFKDAKCYIQSSQHCTVSITHIIFKY